MFEITILGTACMMPTRDRNHAAMLLAFKGDYLLFDCGEGTQRQLKQIGFAAPKIKAIIISHWHGDHVLGLPGLLQSLAASHYQGTLKIYGPKGTKEKIEKLSEVFDSETPLPMEVLEITKEGIIMDKEEYVIKAYELEHNIQTYGFRFEEKDRRKMRESVIKKLGIPKGPLLGKLQNGESVTFEGKKINPNDVSELIRGKHVGLIMDTIICENAFKIGEKTDLLICESAYAEEHKDKSEEYKHMTAKGAAQIASQSGAKKLVLTHFSQRYKDTSIFLREAKEIFDNTVLAHDLIKVNVD